MCSTSKPNTVADKGFEFKGIKEAQQVFDALGKRFGAKVMNKILRKNAKPLVVKARELAPSDNGDLKKAIGVLGGRAGRRGQEVLVGPRRGGSFKGYSGHLVEYGTGPRTKANGASTGSMPAKPYMRPAVASEAEAVIEGIKADCRLLLKNDFRDLDFNTGEIMEGLSTGGSAPSPRQRPTIHTGPKGGRYYFAKSGKKIYIK